MASQDSKTSLTYNVYTDTGKPVDTFPLIQMDEKGYMFIDSGTNAEDLDINLNGMTLYPNIDYAIYKPASGGASADDPMMVILRRTIPENVKFKLEIYKLATKENHTYFWEAPAYTSASSQSQNIFSMDDDRLIFIPGIKNLFSVYVNNYRIQDNEFDILDAQTIRINTDRQPKPYKNVMVRFSYSDHVNLQLIMDYYKYKHLPDSDSKPFHATTNNIISDRFDELVGDASDTGNSYRDSRKMILMSRLNDQTKDAIIDTNKETDEVWDTFIDGHPFGDGGYLNHSEFFDMNKIKNPYDPKGAIWELQPTLLGLKDPKI